MISFSRQNLAICVNSSWAVLSTFNRVKKIGSRIFCALKSKTINQEEVKLKTMSSYQTVSAVNIMKLYQRERGHLGR